MDSSDVSGIADAKPFRPPEWLDRLSVDDALVGAAYEKTSARQRASLKKTIACLACLYGESPLERENKRRFRLGVVITERELPAPFALVICPADYAFPQRFLAALMPAVFAGISAVLPCFLSRGSLPEAGRAEVSPALLAAVDLSGVEQAYVLDDDSLEKLLGCCMGLARPGRVVELYDPASSREGKELATFLPDLPRHVLVDPGTDEAPENTGQPGLCLDREYQDIWAWPQLVSPWFRNRSLCISSPVSGENS